mgnify:CR=1 FL=1
MFSKIKIIIIWLIAILSIILFCIWQNNSITITESDYINSKIPEEFNNFKIAHISDLHNKEFGKDQKYILSKLKSAAPDVIVITGDLIDRRRFNLDKAMTFVEGAMDIAPVFYVSGNHEAWSGEYETIVKRLEDAGVYIVDDDLIKLSIEESSILILGVKDPDFLTSSYIEGTNITAMKEQLEKWSSYKEFKILLSHRPELFDLYCAYNMHLIFTGHAHGGQFRIPFIGGLVAPDQGLFPKYTSGSYSKGISTMFVSRGLGNSIIPIRIFNRPEIVVVNLKTENR